MGLCFPLLRTVIPSHRYWHHLHTNVKQLDTYTHTSEWRHWTYCRWRSRRPCRWGGRGSEPGSWPIHRCPQTATGPGWMEAPPLLHCACLCINTHTWKQMGYGAPVELWLSWQWNFISRVCYEEHRVSLRRRGDSLSMCSSVSEYLEKSAVKESIESSCTFPPGCYN